MINNSNYANVQNLELAKHNDSLFESSKASTNNQTSMIRRQFKQNQQRIMQ